MKFLQALPLQFYPIVYQLIIISNHLFQLTPMKRDKVVKTGLAAPSSQCSAAAPRLQAHFRDPKAAEQTKAKSPVPWFLPQLKHTPQKSIDPDEVLQRCLSSHSAYVNIEMAGTQRGAVTCQALAGPTATKAIVLPWRNYVVLTVADSKPALNRCPPGTYSLLLTKDYCGSSSFTTSLTHTGSLLSSSSYFQVLAAHKVAMAIIAVWHKKNLLLTSNQERRWRGRK